MPERLTLATRAHQPGHAAWLAQFGDARARDIYRTQVAELAEVRLPGGSSQARQAFIEDYEAREPGVWSYYPWLNVALRTLDARLGAAAEADHSLAALFPALISRVTDKRGYPPEAVEPLRLPWPEGTGVYYAADRESREYLAGLHREAAGELAHIGSFARELAGWLRSDPADPRRDGMTVPLPPDAAGALIAALSVSGEPLKHMAERDAEALAAGPLAGLLTSAEDTEAAWVHAGLAWQHLALAAHARGLAVAPLTAIVENPRTRHAASVLVPAGQHIQMLFRLGRSPGPLAPTARRDPTW